VELRGLRRGCGTEGEGDVELRGRRKRRGTKRVEEKMWN